MRAVKAAGRPLFLWGASRAGEAFLGMINGHSLPVTGFIDSDPAKRGQSLQGLSIYTPEQFHTLIDRKPRPFVVITSQFETEIAAAAEAMGLQENQDYIAG
jgi:FlaA1/EpsC-like NDP-sugar epimerase